MMVLQGTGPTIDHVTTQIRQRSNLIDLISWSVLFESALTFVEFHESLTEMSVKAKVTLLICN